MITLIDNYDSFTFNIVQFLGELGVKTHVVRNDAQSAEEVLAQKPQAIILSPGPGRPEQAGICEELVRQAPPALPILGICLGCQAIGTSFGAKVSNAPLIMHGKLSAITHNNSPLFADVPSPFVVARYHSLAIERDSLPETLTITAQSSDSIMAVQHKSQPIFGVQFHPESIATLAGYQLFANFCAQADIPTQSLPPAQPDVIAESVVQQ